MELLSGDGLSRLEVDSSGLVHEESLGLHYGCADVADGFHRTRLFGEIRNFFCFPGVSIKYLKMTESEGIQVSPWPTCCSLPMGFPWSLSFAQSANRARLNRQPSLRHGVEMTDRADRSLFVCGQYRVIGEMGPPGWSSNAQKGPNRG